MPTSKRHQQSPSRKTVAATPEATSDVIAIVATFSKMFLEMEEKRRKEENERRQAEDDRRRVEDEARRAQEEERLMKILEAIRPPAANIPVDPVSNHSSANTIVNSQPFRRNDFARIVGSNPPVILPLNTSVGEFRKWRLLWDDYVVLTHLDDFSHTERLAIFRRALDQDVRDVLDQLGLEHSDDTDVTIKQYLDALEHYFQEKRDLGREREAFERRIQEAGETFDHFLIALRNLGKDADLCHHCFDQRIADRIRVGLHDDEIRRRLMAIRPYPEIEEVIAFCRREEVGRKFAVAQSHVMKVNQQRPDHTLPMRRSRSRSQKRNAQGPERCTKCGYHKHRRDQTCPAIGKVCNKCKGKNHFASECCRNKSPTQQQHTANRNNSLEPVGFIAGTQVSNIVANSGVEPTPPMHVTVKSMDGTVLKENVLSIPDSGSPTNIMSEAVFKSLAIPMRILKPTKQDLCSCEREQLQLIGEFKAMIQINERETQTLIKVSKNTTGFLLGWRTMQKLGILHDEFPNPVYSISPLNVVSDLLKNIPEKPSESDKENVKRDLMQVYADVFDDSKILQPMIGDPMKIHIKEGAIPFAVTAARKVPFALRKQVREKLQQMCDQGIIRRVGDEATQWCHPLVIVRKSDGGVRICTDFTKLNKQCARPHYPQRTPKDAVDSVRRSDKYFSVLDAKNGYWQLELDEVSQPLTTFISSEGRFCYLRAPQGLLSAGDEFNRRGDVALMGVENVEKVVDDMLVHTETFPEHVKNIVEVLERCRKNKITLSPSKFQFAADEVHFVGYEVGAEGVKADCKKVEAIAKFPQPTNLTQLRSFFGLVNQLGQFSKDVSAAAEPLRPLLKQKNIFQWTAAHTNAFEKVKEALCAPPVLAPFDSSLPIEIHTDASRNGGLGFALLQKVSEKTKSLVQCGSRFISETEARYAMVELEMLGVIWAIEKCRMYLLGRDHFTVVVDHKPLVPILNEKTMDVIENPRLMRMKERLLPYNFTASWCRGKHHCIPDALSRAPVKDPTSEDSETELEMKTLMVAHIQMLLTDINEARSLNDPILAKILDAAKQDEEYQQLIRYISSGCPDETNFKTDYRKLKDELSVEDGLILYQARIVIPRSMRKEILARLHDSHQGIERTKQRARQTVFWPGMTSDVKNVVDACASCQERRASLPKEPELSEPLPSRPFEEVAADIFSFAGKHYLAYVDRFSGWLEVTFLSTINTGSLIRHVRRLFSSLGVPVKFRSDGGPQFSSMEFEKFLKTWGVKHAISAPHYPQSNGLAESAVKSLKNLVASASQNGNLDTDSFHSGLLELRNTPKQTGLSPAQVLFGHPLRSRLPAHKKAFQSCWKELACEIDRKCVAPPNIQGKPLHTLSIGDEVWIQNTETRRWDATGIVIGSSGRNYHLKLPSGRVWWRNRRHICKRLACQENIETKKVTFSEHALQEKTEVRRSERLRLQDMQK